MGVDYFPCNHCGEIICDCGPFEEFNIEEYGPYVVCIDCAKKLKDLLKSGDRGLWYCTEEFINIKTKLIDDKIKELQEEKHIWESLKIK